MTPIGWSALRVLGFAAVLGGLVAGSTQLPSRLELTSIAPVARMYTIAAALSGPTP